MNKFVVLKYKVNEEGDVEKVPEVYGPFTEVEAQEFLQDKDKEDLENDEDNEYQTLIIRGTT